MTDAQAELTRIESEMRSLSPTTDRWWELRPRRNELRDQIDPEWRVLHGYGTESDHSALDWPWPEDVVARWRILRAYLEDARGVRLGDVERPFTTSLDEWLAIVEQLRIEGWGYVFRDSIKIGIMGKTRFAIMISGEGDYYWTIHTKDKHKLDPRVCGYYQDFMTSKWTLARASAAPDSEHGSFPHITDFVLRKLRVYKDRFRPHPRLCFKSEHAARTRIREALAQPIPPGRVLYRAPTGDEISDGAFDEVIARVRDSGADYWTAPATVRHRYGFTLDLRFVEGGFYVSIERAGLRMRAAPPELPELPELHARSGAALSRAQTELAIRHFAALGEQTPELKWLFDV